jgi:hypothetical protein
MKVNVATGERAKRKTIELQASEKATIYSREKDHRRKRAIHMGG